MKKEKLVKKYLPVQPFDMAGLEEWLSDLAAQGLFLVKIDLNKAKFRRDTPKTGVRYALDVAGPYGIDGERNENYAQMGWDYVTTLALSMASFMYYVYRSDDPQAPALHTDLVTQGGTITTLIRRKRRNLALMLVLLLFILRTDVITLFTAPWAIPRFTILYTERAVQWLALMIPYLLLLFLPEVRMLRALGKLRRQLLDGIPLERERRWPRRFPSSLLLTGIGILAVLLMAVHLWMEPRLSHEMTEAEERAFPHVTVEQVLGGAAFTSESPYGKMLHPNTFRTSLLCPEQYKWSQGSEADPQGVREVWLSVQYYRTRSEGIAKVLLSCLIKDYKKAISDAQKRQDEFVNTYELTVLAPFHQIVSGPLDEVWMMEEQWDDEPAIRCYIGRCGDQVFRLLCRSVPDPEECLKLMSQRLV